MKCGYNIIILLGILVFWPIESVYTQTFNDAKLYGAAAKSYMEQAKKQIEKAYKDALNGYDEEVNRIIGRYSQMEKTKNPRAYRFAVKNITRSLYLKSDYEAYKLKNELISFENRTQNTMDNVANSIISELKKYEFNTHDRKPADIIKSTIEKFKGDLRLNVQMSMFANGFYKEIKKGLTGSDKRNQLDGNIVQDELGKNTTPFELKTKIMTERKRMKEIFKEYRDNLLKLDDTTLEFELRNISMKADMALLVSQSYYVKGKEDRVLLPKGYQIVDNHKFRRLLSNAQDNGLKCELYLKDGKYFLAFPGTAEKADYEENVYGKFYNSHPLMSKNEAEKNVTRRGLMNVEIKQTQAWFARKLVDELLESEEIDTSNLIILGHSLGGRLVAESIVGHGGIESYVFNATDISNETKNNGFSNEDFMKFHNIHTNREFLEDLKLDLKIGKYEKIQNGPNDHGIVEFSEVLLDFKTFVIAEQSRRKYKLKEHIPCTSLYLEGLNRKESEKEGAEKVNNYFRSVKKRISILE